MALAFFYVVSVLAYMSPNTMGTYIRAPHGTHLLFEWLWCKVLEGITDNTYIWKPHLFVNLIETLEVDNKISGETLSPWLLFIPVPHADVPRAMLSIVSG